jgi:type I restriction enzyme S subunit
MRSNYKRLGDYIREVDVRKEGLKITNLLCLTVNKVFIPSVANTIGTDMERYKLSAKTSLLAVRCKYGEMEKCLSPY